MSMTNQSPSVAAVIPTTGRSSLTAAVDSVLSQERRADVVIVATSEECLPRVRKCLSLTLAPSEVQLVSTSQPKPVANLLRRLGTQAATCDYYAFLDDDDRWLPGKLSSQLALAESSSAHVLASRLILTGADAVGTVPIPAEIYSGQNVSDYLFAGRKLRVARPLLHTSTLVVRSDALGDVNWDPNLGIHQDWDLLLRLAEAGYDIVQSGEALSLVETGTTSSMSATNRWERSLEWWNQSRSRMSEQAAADFLFAQVLRYALSERSSTGVRAVLATARDLPGRPSGSALTLAVSGVVPRRYFEKAMLLVARLRRYD